MQMQVNQGQIEKAVRAYVQRLGLNLPITAIKFSQTRNPSGIQADIEFNLDDAEATDEAPKASPADAAAPETEANEDSTPDAGEDEGSDEDAGGEDTEASSSSNASLFSGAT